MTSGVVPEGAAVDRFRPDVQALRAIAVAAVFVYHLWPHRLPGGYVGVDVFFVISGYLITAHLLHELTSTGTIRLGRFWSRRAKRLLPSSLLVLAAVAVAVIAWVPRTLWPQFLSEIVASVLYVQNWFLAASSVEYSAADNSASPVQHFWTLSVEEQFYIALPLILLAAAFVFRGRARRQTMLVWVVGFITAASFAYSFWYTGWAEGPAYFSTLTRGWEFGVGALVAFLPRLGTRAAREVAVAIGLVLITVSAISFTADTPFPGAAAAVPVVGTAMIMWLGAGTFVTALGRFAPVALLGRISYAVYLWHWPPIVLIPYITGQPLDLAQRVGILVGATLVAWVSTTQWEDRIRFAPRLLGRARPRRIAAWTAFGMVVALAIPAAGLTVDAVDRQRIADAGAAIAAGQPECFGADALASDCTNPALAGVLVPSPANAKDDDDNRSDCWSRGEDTSIHVCSLGPATGYERHLLAVGDSHNNALIGAYEIMARDNNWRIDVTGRAGCYWTDARLTQPTTQLEEACALWRTAVSDHIEDARDIDAIVTTKQRRDFTREVVGVSEDDAADAVVEGMVSAWNRRGDLSVPVIALVDNPRGPEDVLVCVEENPDDAAQECGRPRDEALRPDDGLALAVARSDNARAIDLTDLYCTDDFCPAVVGNALVYRDDRGHLTSTFARTLAPMLADEIEDVLDGATRR